MPVIWQPDCMIPGAGRPPCVGRQSTPIGRPTRKTDSRNPVFGGCRHDCYYSAASRCMNSSGLNTRCVVPTLHGVLSLSSTCPAALSCTRSSDSAGTGATHRRPAGAAAWHARSRYERRPGTRRCRNARVRLVSSRGSAHEAAPVQAQLYGPWSRAHAAGRR